MRQTEDRFIRDIPNNSLGAILKNIRLQESHIRETMMLMLIPYTADLMHMI